MGAKIITQATTLYDNKVTIPQEMRAWLAEHGGIIGNKVHWISIRTKPRDQSKAIIEIALDK